MKFAFHNLQSKIRGICIQSVTSPMINWIQVEKAVRSREKDIFEKVYC
jgi:hypothetical protein